jgi:hypothetical protein
MAANGLVAADTILDPGEEELESEEERDESHANHHSYRAQLLSDHEETASEGSQIGNEDGAGSEAENCM